MLFPGKQVGMTENCKKLRIFVVDDEQVISWTITLILRHHGYEATAFTDSLQALAATRAHAPDLLISDIEMPRLSGVHLATRVRECVPYCKVLFFSDETTAELLQIARANALPFECLLKPLDPKVLAQQGSGNHAVHSGLAIRGRGLRPRTDCREQEGIPFTGEDNDRRF